MSTDELLRRLDELGAELKVRDRPERRAWTALGPTRNGWTARPYDDQAFRLWKEVLRRFPDDLSSVHHLAIMHHARAIDTEQSDHPARSDDDWRKALTHWHRLFEADEFWAELSERVDAEPDPVPQVRQDLAEQLLRMHFDIALDENSPHHRARFHVRLALDSPFPRELVEGVRLRAYERAVADLDPAVWRPGTLDPETLRPAIAIVIHYLDLDEDCAAALNDLLKLLKRLESGQVNQANGVSEPDELSRALDEIRTTAQQYDGYISRLEPLLLEADEPDDLALSDLVLWHSRAAQAFQMASAHDAAVRYYERALRAAEVGADPRAGEMRAEWLLATVLAAREHATDDVKQARRLLKYSEKFTDLPVLVLLLRAQVGEALGDLDEAEHDIETALSALESPRDEEPPWDEDPERLRAECLGLRDRIRRVRLDKLTEPHLEKADRAMRSKDWSKAIDALNAALAIDRDSILALVRRAECYMFRLETDAATADLDHAEKLCRTAGAVAEDLDFLRQMRETLRPLHQEVRSYGGPEAYRLQQAGIKAFNDGRHDEAIGLLRNARKAARPSSRKLDADLAFCLNGAACRLVEPMAANPGGRHDLTEILRAQLMLDEAQRLDGTRTEIERNLLVVNELFKRSGLSW